MSYYLWEMRPYFQQVAGQLVLGSITGFIMNTAVVLPPILLGWAIDTALAVGRGDVGPGAMGVVLQVVQLFRGTVFDNLTLGDGSVSRHTVQRAVAIAGADAFIQALPQGYDTLLGSGLQLSAGQRQLLALTRALVWDPAVLLLDEATAAVDSASEAAFRAALRTAVIGRGRAVPGQLCGAPGGQISYRSVPAHHPQGVRSLYQQDIRAAAGEMSCARRCTGGRS